MIFQCKENSMNKYDTIFLDRDGTLNPDSGYINSLDQFQFYRNKLNLRGIYFCPDHPDNATINRKPGIGMFKAAAKDHHIDLKNSIMIGDALSDIKAGLNLNMDTMLVMTGRGEKSKDNLKGFNPKFIVKDIMDGAKTINRHFR